MRSSPTVAEADSELLRRALQNVLSNAIDYTPKGVVEVDAMAEGIEPCFRSPAPARGSPRTTCRRSFRKFHSNNRMRGGIGLAVVKTIIDAHGGDVRIESRTGRGTTVRFSLPRNAVDRADEDQSQ